MATPMDHEWPKLLDTDSFLGCIHGCGAVATVNRPPGMGATVKGPRGPCTMRMAKEIERLGQEVERLKEERSG